MSSQGHEITDFNPNNPAHTEDVVVITDPEAIRAREADHARDSQEFRQNVGWRPAAPEQRVTTSTRIAQLKGLTRSLGDRPSGEE